MIEKPTIGRCMMGKPLVGELYISIDPLNLYTNFETIENETYFTTWIAQDSCFLFLKQELYTKQKWKGRKMKLSSLLYNNNIYIFSEATLNKNELFNRHFKPLKL